MYIHTYYIYAILYSIHYSVYIYTVERECVVHTQIRTHRDIHKHLAILGGGVW